LEVELQKEIEWKVWGFLRHAAIFTQHRLFLQALVELEILLFGCGEQRDSWKLFQCHLLYKFSFESHSKLCMEPGVLNFHLVYFSSGMFPTL